MLQILFQVISFFFLIMGVVYCVECAVIHIGNMRRKSEQGTSLIMKVKNQQDDVEGSVRDLVWRCKNGYSSIPDIVVVDMGSSDDTMHILKNLQKEYDFLKVMTVEEYNSQ